MIAFHVGIWYMGFWHAVGVPRLALGNVGGQGLFDGIGGYCTLRNYRLAGLPQNLYFCRDCTTLPHMQ